MRGTLSFSPSKTPKNTVYLPKNGSLWGRIAKKNNGKCDSKCDPNRHISFLQWQKM